MPDNRSVPEAEDGPMTLYFLGGESGESRMAPIPMIRLTVREGGPVLVDLLDERGSAVAYGLLMDGWYSHDLGHEVTVADGELFLETVADGLRTSSYWAWDRD